MAASVNEYHQILEIIDRLESVQAAFSEYQDAHFASRPPEFFALELAGEAGEVANNEKKLWKGRTVAEADIADEAADVFIALMNYANSRGVQLHDAVKVKLMRIESIRVQRMNEGLDY